jgi:hypothetical protein
MSVTSKRQGRIGSREVTVQFVTDVAEILSEGIGKYVAQQLSSLGPAPPLPKDGDYSSAASEMRSKRHRWEMRNAELAALNRLTVAIETVEGDNVVYHNEKLKDIRFPAHIKKIAIDVGRSYAEFGAKVELEFKPSVFGEGSSYLIEGQDKHTVLGLEATLRQKLSEDTSLRDFLYRGEFLLLIDIFIALLNAWVFWSIGTVLNVPSVSPTSVLVFTGSVYVMPWILRWLFPVFTYTEDSKNTVRRALKAVFGTAYGALNLLGLLAQFTGYKFSAGSTQTVTTTLTAVSTLTQGSGGIPGFVPESIIAGLSVGLIVVLLLRKRRRRLSF